MTIQRIERICVICGQKYMFNPDVGLIFCDQCGKKARRKKIWLGKKRHLLEIGL